MNELENNAAEGQEQPEIMVNQSRNAADPTVAVVVTGGETVAIEGPTHVEIVHSKRPRKVYGGMWGRTELVVFGVSLSTLLLVLVVYLYFVVPSSRELEQNRAERDRLEQELISARSKYGDITTTESQVAKLVASVNDFESAFLPIASTGRTSLYQRLNGLIAGYSLVNTNGPNYAPLELNEQESNGNGAGQSEQEQGRAKFKSIFPGVYVTMTVEGSYQNVRRFLREIETANEFVIISSVELEPTETKKKEDNTQPPATQQPVAGQNFPAVTQRGGFDPTRNPGMQTQVPQPQPPQGKTHGETVSLRLEMAAYFRRENVGSAVPNEIK